METIWALAVSKETRIGWGTRQIYESKLKISKSLYHQDNYMIASLNPDNVLIRVLLSLSMFV